MVSAGFESDALFVLLGEVPPFNVFEMEELLDKMARELGLPKVRSTKEAIYILTTGHAKRLMDGVVAPRPMLAAVCPLVEEIEFDLGIYDFWRLYHAYSFMIELGHVFQPYWDSVTLDNIEETTRTVCKDWIKENPLTDWSPFEWSKGLR